MACEEEDSTIELCPENTTVSPTPGATKKGVETNIHFCQTFAVLFQSKNMFDHEPKS